MQGFGGLAKDFCFHPKSNKKLSDRFRGTYEEDIGLNLF